MRQAAPPFGYSSATVCRVIHRLRPLLAIEPIGRTEGRTRSARSVFAARGHGVALGTATSVQFRSGLRDPHSERVEGDRGTAQNRQLLQSHSRKRLPSTVELFLLHQGASLRSPRAPWLRRSRG